MSIDRKNRNGFNRRFHRAAKPQPQWLVGRVALGGPERSVAVKKHILFDDPKNLQPKEGDEKGQKQWRKLRRGVADLYRRAQVSHQANYRYLEALASVTGTTPLRQQATGVCQAVRYRGRGYRRLNPLAQADEKDHVRSSPITSCGICGFNLGICLNGGGRTSVMPSE